MHVHSCEHRPMRSVLMRCCGVWSPVHIWNNGVSTVAPVACVAGAKIVDTLLEFDYAQPYGGAVRASEELYSRVVRYRDYWRLLEYLQSANRRAPVSTPCAHTQ